MAKKDPDKIEADRNIDDLKTEYSKYLSKYSLPEFSELNKLFDIEGVDLQTEFFLRKVRRVISDRISAYLRFAEIILNPSNAPMFFFKLVKKLDSKDRENLSEVYESLSLLELEVIRLDLDYSEINEADFIKKTYKLFDEDSRVKLLEIIKKLGNGDNNNKKENNGSYFG
jgi:hypothetical protein